MTGERKKEREHAYKRIGRDLKAGNIPALILLCGEENYLTAFYMKELISRYVNSACMSMDLLELDRDTFTLGQLIESSETVSFMSERKVILIRDLVDSRGRFPKEFNDARGAQKDLFEYFQRLPEGILLLITAAKPVHVGERDKISNGKNLNKLKKFIDKMPAGAGAYYDFGHLNSPQLRDFIIKRLRAAGKVCGNQVLNTMVYDTGYGSDTCDYDLYTLENDIRKIIAHSGEASEITDEDLKDVISDNPDKNIFEMMHSIGTNHKEEAFKLLNNLMDSGISEFGIISQLVSQCELVLIARELRDEGCSPNECKKIISSQGKVHEYRAQKACELSKRFSKADARRMLESACALDGIIKGGTLSTRLALEFFIANI